MMQKGKMTRREFIRLSAVGAAGAVLTACAAPTEVAVPTQAVVQPTATKPVVNIAATATTGPTATPVAKFFEAPMLADMVKAGKLPPIEERLPVNPGVFPTIESIGNYGGAIRRGFTGVSDRWGPTKHIDRGFAWFDRTLAVHPRIAESWEISADAKEWTFYLRKGMKWSDGTPFTTGDIKWWYEYELNNKQITTAIPSAWGTGKPRVVMTIDVIDDYTIKFKFEHPKPMFIYGLLRGMPVTPGFYMKKYHIDQVDDKAKLEAEVKEKGFDSWEKYYIDRNLWYLNPERPSLGPWLADNSLSGELFMMSRNPYFFATDAEGNQLPYLDNVQHRLFETPDVFNLWIVNGEIDFQNRHVAFGNYTLFKESESKGDYKVYLGVSAGHLAMQPNHATKNDKLREFFQNRNVRIAMNLAMNRDEVNELIWDGMLKPRQYSPLPMSPQYYEKASTAYIEYNPDKANELLDAEGYDKKNSEGVRLWKDGSGPITFTIEGTAQAGTPDEDTVQLLVKYLNDVGIKAQYKYFERALYTEHYEANEIEAAFWGGDRTVLPLVPEAIIFRGTQPDRPWAAGYAHFYNNGPDAPNAVEPPEGYFIWKIWDIWEKIAVEPDSDKQTEMFKQILDVWAEEVPMVTLLGEQPAPVIVKNGFRNYAEGAPVDDTTGDEHVYNTETYFWDEPDKHTI